MTDVATPPAESAQASTTVDPAVQALTEANRAIDGAESENKEPAQPEVQKTPEQQRIDDLEKHNRRLQRAIDRRTQKLYEERARRDLTPELIARDNHTSSDDSQPLTLSRSEFEQAVKAEAERLARTLATQDAEAGRKQSVIQSLAKAWGQEKFDSLASDLDDAFGGLRGSDGTPKAAVEAVFEADNPAKVIEYLADPEHSDEADAIARMNPVQAGKAIAKLEARISAEKPKPSKAPAPIEPIRGAGPVTKSLADMDFDEFTKRRKEMIKNR